MGIRTSQEDPPRHTRRTLPGSGLILPRLGARVAAFLLVLGLAVQVGPAAAGPRGPGGGQRPGHSPLASQVFEGNVATVTTVAGDGRDMTIDGIGEAASFTDIGGVTLAGGFVYVGTRGSIRRVDTDTKEVERVVGHPTQDDACVDSTDKNDVRFPSIKGIAAVGTNLFTLQLCDFGDGLVDAVRKTSLATGATETMATIDAGFATAITAAGDMLYVTSWSAASEKIVVRQIDSADGSATVFTEIPLEGNLYSVSAGITSDDSYLWLTYHASYLLYRPTVARQSRIRPLAPWDPTLVRISLASGTPTNVSLDDHNFAANVVASAGEDLWVPGGPSASGLRLYEKASGEHVDVAGDDVPGYVDATGSWARFSDIGGMAFDGEDMWIADTGNNRLRKARLGVPEDALEVVAIEANQAVQDWNNSVPLVAGKPTVVRVFLEAQSGQTVETTGRLRAFVDGEEVIYSPLPPLNPGGTILADDDARDGRETLEGSLNFRIPAAWAYVDQQELELLVELPGGQTCERGGTTTFLCGVSLTFNEVAAFDAKFVGISWDDGEGLQQVSTDDLMEQSHRVWSTYPIAEYVFDYEWFTSDHRPTLDEVNFFLSVARILQDGGDVDRPWYAAIAGSPEDEDAPGGTAAGPVASGWLGNSGPVEAEGYSRNRPAHEMGHSLGLYHTVNAEENGWRWYGYKLGWCDEEASPLADDYPNFALTDDGYRPTLGPLEFPWEGNGLDEIWGLDTRFVERNESLAVSNPWEVFPLMSYCLPVDQTSQGRWISSRDYVDLYDQFSDPGEASSQPFAMSESSETGAGLLIHGTVDLETGAVELGSTYSLTDVAFSPADPGGEFELRLLDGSGVVLDSLEFSPAPLIEDVEQDGLGRAMFTLTLPDPGEDLHTIAVYQDTMEAGTKVASAHAPSVTVDTPAGGEIGEQSVELSWQGNDADNDPLTYSVLYSPDAGVTWNVVAADLASSSLTLQREGIDGSDEAMVRVLASDGVNTASDTSGTFAVPNLTPIVRIERPLEQATFQPGQTVTLDGTVYDIEDGMIDGESVTWLSSLDGEIAQGVYADIPAEYLSIGTHELTLTAHDSDETTSSDSVEIIIGEPSPTYETVTLQPEDTYVRDDAPATNFDGETMLSVSSVGQTGTAAEAFLRWGFTGLPENAVIESAEMSMKIADGSEEWGRFHPIYEAAGPWNPTTLSWNTHPGYGSEFTWVDLGGPTGTEVLVDMTSLASNWLTSPETNYGIVVGADQFGTGYEIGIGSEEQDEDAEGDPGLLPTLTLTYSLAPTYQEVTFQPEDTYVREDASNTNYEGETTLAVSGTGETGFAAESYLRWDLDELPDDATIDSAYMSLTVADGVEEEGLAHLVREAGGPWESNTLTWDSRPEDGQGFIWVDLGGTTGTEILVEVTALVAEWHASPVTNFGVVIASSDLGAEYEVELGSEEQDESSGGDPLLVPTLTIIYSEEES